MEAYTIAIIIIAITLLIVYDIAILMITRNSDNTISSVLLKLSKRWPVIAFAIGFIMGHIFWPNC